VGDERGGRDGFDASDEGGESVGFIGDAREGDFADDGGTVATPTDGASDEGSLGQETLAEADVEDVSGVVAYEEGEEFSDDLVGAPTEEFFGAWVPGADASEGIDAEGDGVVRGCLRVGVGPGSRGGFGPGVGGSRGIRGGFGGAGFGLSDQLAGDLSEPGFEIGDGGFFGFVGSGGGWSGGQAGNEGIGEVPDPTDFFGGVASDVTGGDDEDAQEAVFVEDGGDHSGFEPELDEGLVEVGDPELGPDGEGEDGAVDLDPLEGVLGNGGTVLDEAIEVRGDLSGDGEYLPFGIADGDDGQGHGKGRGETFDALLQALLKLSQLIVTESGQRHGLSRKHRGRLL